MPAAGSLNSRVEQWREVVMKPATTDAPEERSWAHWRSFWAGQRRANEAERFAAAAAQRFAVRSVIFTTHFFEDIKESDQLRCDGLTYDIRGIGMISYREGLEITAEAQP